MFNPNDFTYDRADYCYYPSRRMSPAALEAFERMQEEALAAEEAEEEDTHRAAVLAYEDAFEETLHCTAECSALDSTAHSDACQAAHAAAAVAPAIRFTTTNSFGTKVTTCPPMLLRGITGGTVIPGQISYVTVLPSNKTVILGQTPFGGTLVIEFQEAA